MLLQGLAAALAVAVAAAGMQTWRLDALKAEHAKQAMEAAAAAINAEREKAQRAQEIDRDTETRLQAARRAADRARNDADGLRNALAARASDDPATTGCADVAAERDRLAGLLAEGGALVAECEARGGVLAQQVTGLQRHAAEVCGAVSGQEH